MPRPTFEELRDRRLNTMSPSERVEYDEALTEARRALQVGDKAREARASGRLRQRDVAAPGSTG